MTQPVWPLTDKEKIKKTLELIEDFENSGSSKHYKANAQKMRIMLDAIKKNLRKIVFQKCESFKNWLKRRFSCKLFAKFAKTCY